MKAFFRISGEDQTIGLVIERRGCLECGGERSALMNYMGEERGVSGIGLSVFLSGLPAGTRRYDTSIWR